ncbi:MAG: DUF1194 domain-containing protein [Gammaproteobacteria bacterium]|nr:DUF1194 domain-containing protein [Gammaproteobacteria bacterium]
MIRTAWLVATIAWLATAAAGAQDSRGQLPVDLELVIAVDVSRSMDREEFELQRFGYIDAIRDPDFVRAIRRGKSRRIALSYVEWSGSRLQRIVIPWRLIDGGDSAVAFADELAGHEIPRSHSGDCQDPAECGTSISAALSLGADLLDANSFEGERRVIDISGDGPNNSGRPATEARDKVLTRGIIINGLPILIRPSPVFPEIDRYYSDCVIGGQGSFVLPVYQAEELAIAIRRKLILEVAGVLADQLIQVGTVEPVDCLIGERSLNPFLLPPGD